MSHRLVLLVAFMCIAQLGVTMFKEFTPAARTTSSTNPVDPSAPIGPEARTQGLTRSHESPRSSMKAAETQQSPQSSNQLRPNTVAAKPGTTPSVTTSAERVPTTSVSSGRRDPFVPFFSNKNPPAPDDKEPLARYDLNELRLTAVIRDSSGNYVASIETSQGKTFIVRKGNRVGTNGGVISEIAPSSIIISEPNLDPIAQKTPQRRELAMKAPPTPVSMSVATPSSVRDTAPKH